jgi:hypothetical protein
MPRPSSSSSAWRAVRFRFPEIAFKAPPRVARCRSFSFPPAAPVVGKGSRMREHNWDQFSKACVQANRASPFRSSFRVRRLPRFTRETGSLASGRPRLHSRFIELFRSLQVLRRVGPSNKRAQCSASFCRAMISESKGCRIPILPSLCAKHGVRISSSWSEGGSLFAEPRGDALILLSFCWYARRARSRNARSR